MRGLTDTHSNDRLPFAEPLFYLLWVEAAKEDTRSGFNATGPVRRMPVSRLVSVDGTPGTQRNRLRRTIAEALRLLVLKQTLDDEAKDLAATIVFALRGIREGVEQTAAAWEKRNYFLKADRFRMEWDWVPRVEREMTEMILLGEWHRLLPVLGELTGRFHDVTVTKVTRSAQFWEGAYERLLEEKSAPAWRGKV